MEEQILMVNFAGQVGIWAENGSGGFIGDIVFSGGLYGILCGNQQFTATFLVFQSCKNAIGLIWDWAWTWSQLLVVSCEVAINMNPPGASASDPAGSIYLVDSDFVTNDVFIKTFPFQNTEQGTTVFTFDNLHYGENGEFIQFPDGSYLDFDGGTDSYIDLMTIGDIEINGVLDGFYYLSAPDRPAALTGTGASIGYPHQWWQRRPKPTYQDVPAGDFLNAMDYAWGDGVTDDTGELDPSYISSSFPLFYIKAFRFFPNIAKVEVFQAALHVFLFCSSLIDF